MWGPFCETYAPSSECSLEDIIRNDINKYQEECSNTTDNIRRYIERKISVLEFLLKYI